MVRDHQAVAAQAGAAGIAAVFIVIKQAFLMHQALRVSPVALLVLGAQAALRVCRTIENIETPDWRQLALCLVSGKQRVEDVDDRHVLEDATVTAMGEKRAPRLQRQVIARHAAVRTDQLDGGDMAVERAQRVGAGSCQQLQQGRLANQGAQGNGGVRRQGRDLEHEARAQAFLAAHAFGQQAVSAKRRGQL